MTALPLGGKLSIYLLFLPEPFRFDIKNAAYLKEQADRQAVTSGLVFLYLLKADTDRLSQCGLRQAELKSLTSDICTNNTV